MAHAVGMLDPLLAHITNGDVDDVKQMFRDRHVQGYTLPPKRHEALCATIRNTKISDSDRADIVRLLTCNIDGFDPHFEGGKYRKTIVQIAFDEGQCSLLPLLMRENQLNASTVHALLLSFKLNSDDASEASAAIGLAAGAESTVHVSFHPLDLVPVSNFCPVVRESDPQYIGRHYHYLRYLLNECSISAAALYRKSHGQVVAVSRNSAFNQQDGSQFLCNFFPISEDAQIHGLTINGRPYAYVSALDHVAHGTLCSWAQFVARNHDETLLFGGSRDLIVAAQFGTDINSLNPEFHEEEDEEDAKPRRTSSLQMPGHRHAAGDTLNRASLGLRLLLEAWIEHSL